MDDAHQSCERCGKQVHITAVGLCPGCRTYWFPGGEFHPREAVRQPTTVECSRAPGQLTLRWRWRNHGGIAAIAVIAVLAAVLHFVAKTDLVLLVFLPITCWWGLAQELNSTWVTVEGGWLRVRSGPIPLRLPVHLRTGEVRQLFSQKEIHRGPSGPATSGSSGAGSTFVVYSLSACVAPDDHRVKLVTGAQTPDVPLFLERELERELGIADAPVPEELRRAAPAASAPAGTGQ